jgi:hypothetical protein
MENKSDPIYYKRYDDKVYNRCLERSVQRNSGIRQANGKYIFYEEGF